MSARPGYEAARHPQRRPFSTNGSALLDERSVCAQQRRDASLFRLRQQLRCSRYNTNHWVEHLAICLGRIDAIISALRVTSFCRVFIAERRSFVACTGRIAEEATRSQHDIKRRCARDLLVLAISCVRTPIKASDDDITAQTAAAFAVKATSGRTGEIVSRRRVGTVNCETPTQPGLQYQQLLESSPHRMQEPRTGVEVPISTQ